MRLHLLPSRVIIIEIWCFSTAILHDNLRRTANWFQQVEKWKLLNNVRRDVIPCNCRISIDAIDVFIFGNNRLDRERWWNDFWWPLGLYISVFFLMATVDVGSFPNSRLIHQFLLSLANNCKIELRTQHRILPEAAELLRRHHLLILFRHLWRDVCFTEIISTAFHVDEPSSEIWDDWWEFLQRWKWRKHE